MIHAITMSHNVCTRVVEDKLRRRAGASLVRHRVVVSECMPSVHFDSTMPLITIQVETDMRSTIARHRTNLQHLGGHWIIRNNQTGATLKNAQ